MDLFMSSNEMKIDHCIPNLTFVHFSASTFMVSYLPKTAVVQKIYFVVLFGKKNFSNISTKALKKHQKGYRFNTHFSWAVTISEVFFDW